MFNGCIINILVYFCTDYYKYIIYINHVNTKLLIHINT